MRTGVTLAMNLWNMPIKNNLRLGDIPLGT